MSALHGVYVDYAIRRFDRMVAQHRPDYVLILLGSNDARPLGMRAVTTPDDYRDALTLLGTLCLQGGAVPVIASPPPRSDADCEYPLQAYAEAACTAANHLSVEFIDLYRSFESRGSLDTLFPDGLHPGPAGNRVLAGDLSTKLIPLLRDRPATCQPARLSTEALNAFRLPERTQAAPG